MKQGLYTVAANEQLTASVFRMTLRGDTSDLRVPGQFVNVKLDGLYLRRPISVFDCSTNTLQLVFKAVGAGTEQMCKVMPDEAIDLLTGLGNGFQTAKSGERPVLIGGGVGIPPLYWLCKKLLEEGKTPTVLLGFNTAEELFLQQEFLALGVPVLVTTVDGTTGIRGFVTDALQQVDYTYFYTCGPMPMFRAVNRVTRTSGQFSFEERMGCGFGACMGCTCETTFGAKRICKDGPVLEKEEILW